MSINVEKINLSFFKTIELREDGFSFKGDFHKFDDIMHLDFYWKKTQVSYNFAKMPTYDTAILSVEKDNEKIVKIKLEGSEEQCNKIFYIYSLLSEKTFVKRYNLYINEMDKNGYFIYDGKYFFPNGKVLSPNKEEYNIKDNPIREPFKLTLSKPKNKFKQFIESAWGGVDLYISTSKDQDVFFTLLKTLYNLRWG